MHARRTLTWLAVATLGVGLTTALTITTTLLAGQPIGLSSEPRSAGNALVPPVASAAPAVVRHKGKAKAKPKPLSRKPQHRSPSVKPVVPTTQVFLAPPPVVFSPTATVPTPARQAGGRGDRHSGELDTSKDKESGGDD